MKIFWVLEKGGHTIVHLNSLLQLKIEEPALSPESESIYYLKKNKKC